MAKQTKEQKAAKAKHARAAKAIQRTADQGAIAGVVSAIGFSNRAARTAVLNIRKQTGAGDGGTGAVYFPEAMASGIPYSDDSLEMMVFQSVYQSTYQNLVEFKLTKVREKRDAALAELDGESGS